MPEELTRSAQSGNLSGQLLGPEKWAFAWMLDSKVTVCVGSCSRTFRSAVQAKSECSVLVGTDLPELTVAPHLFVVESSITRLPFSASSVDTVILLDILARGVEEMRAIDEVQRVLRPGGRLILTLPSRAIMRLDPGTPSGFDRSGRRRSYSDADLTRLLFLKFRVVRQHYAGLFFYPLVLGLGRGIRDNEGGSWRRLLRKIGDIDYGVSWGRWSYELILLAEKV